MTRMTLLATALFGALAFTGGAQAASRTELPRPHARLDRAEHHRAATHGAMRRAPAETRTYGAPRLRSQGDDRSRNTTQNATSESDSSGSLVVPGSDAAIYSFGADKNRQFGY